MCGIGVILSSTHQPSPSASVPANLLGLFPICRGACCDEGSNEKVDGMLTTATAAAKEEETQRSSSSLPPSFSTDIDEEALYAAIARRGHTTHAIAQQLSSSSFSSSSSLISSAPSTERGWSMQMIGSVLSLRPAKPSARRTDPLVEEGGDLTAARRDASTGVVLQPVVWEGTTSSEDDAPASFSDSRCPCVSSHSSSRDLSSSVSWLLWNGEVFGGHPNEDEETESEGHSSCSSSSAVWSIPDDASDTLVVAAQLQRLERECFAAAAPCAADNFAAKVVPLLERIEGPFALIFYSALFQRLYFGRDPVGRRSLLVHRTAQTFIVSSVAAPHEGRTTLHRSADAAKATPSAEDRAPLPPPTSAAIDPDQTRNDASLAMPSTTAATTGHGVKSTPSSISSSANRKERGDDDGGSPEDEAVEMGCWSEVPIGGLFSVAVNAAAAAAPGGGSEGTAPPLQEREQLEPGWEENSALFCVRQHPWDHSETYQHHPLLRQAKKTRLLSSLVEGGLDPAEQQQHEGHTRLLQQLSQQRCGARYVIGSTSGDSDPYVATAYLEALSRAVKRRVHLSTLRANDDGLNTKDAAADAATATTSSPPRVGLLFSGGIDCTVLAALTHYHLPLSTPIELINVGFGSHPDETPDRQTAIASFRQLVQSLSPEVPYDTFYVDSSLRKGEEEKGGTGGAKIQPRATQREWRLVLVDVPQDELDASAPHILSLMYPRQTVMDLNIASAIWFAARGVGTCYTAWSSCVDCLRAKHCKRPRGEEELEKEKEEHETDRDDSIHPTTAKVTPLSKHVRTAAATVQQLQDERDHNNHAPPTDPFGPLRDALVREGVQGECRGRVLLSTLGKEYGATLSPHWRGLGYRRLGDYLHAAAAEGVIVFGGGSTSKYVSLARKEDLDAAEEFAKSQTSDALLTELCRGSSRCRCHHPTREEVGRTHDEPSVEERQRNNDEPCHPSAAQQQQQHTNIVSQSNYRCFSKVLLLGMGADETLGGYSRYRRVANTEQKKFQLQGQQQQQHLHQNRQTNGGTEVENVSRNPSVGADDETPLQRAVTAAVNWELERDFSRLWTRNLGRDDRCVSDHCREGRFPFLDGTVLDCLSQIALEDTGRSSVLDVTLPEGVGEKRVLRTCARMLGLGAVVSTLQKRAIQFGTRVASRMNKGHDKVSFAQ